MKPMLAKKMEEDQFDLILGKGYYQPKLDGVRLVWDGNEALSRNQKPILGMPRLINELKKYFSDIPLDGELYLHGSSFQKALGSIRRTVNIQENEDIKYWVYDTPLLNSQFGDRLQILLLEMF